MPSDNVFVGLDIGTTKVAAVIAEQNENGTLEITGVGQSPSTGLRKGVVVNIESTLRSVAQAIDAAEMMSGREVFSCWTGIGGAHIEGVNSRGVVAVTGKGNEVREISQVDVDRVIEAARAVPIPMDRQVLHVIPQTYIVDEQRGIRNPLDMIGVRLEAEVHIITGTVSSAQNLIKCVNRAGFKVEDLVLQSLASARSTLSYDERELGAIVIDLGGGTSDVLVFYDGAPYYTTTIPVGGAQVTSDISIMKNLSFDTAERIKVQAGCCKEELLEGIEEIIVPGVGGRPPMPIIRHDICRIIEPRMSEIFYMIKEKVDRLSLSRTLGGGVILTGGGSEMVGAAELAHECFGMPVRVGVPVSLGGLVEQYRSPSYSSAVGLIMEAYSRESENMLKSGETRGKSGKREAPFGRILDWVKREFF